MHQGPDAQQVLTTLKSDGTWGVSNTEIWQQLEPRERDHSIVAVNFHTGRGWRKSLPEHTQAVREWGEGLRQFHSTVFPSLHCLQVKI